MSTKVKKLVIQMGDAEATLTTGEARELLAALKSLFGDTAQVVTVPAPYPVYPHWEKYWWTGPHWIGGNMSTTVQAGASGSLSVDQSWINGTIANSTVTLTSRSTDS